MRIEAKAYAKINWALWITGRRPDGYHELDMLMQPVSLCDDLTFEEDDGLSLHVAGGLADEPNNLVLCAARALREQTGARRGARIFLTKRIPARAGMGGGSADCAVALKALNALWGLDLPMETLMRLGLKLGADVPYCLTGGLCRVRGIGELVERVSQAPRAFLALSRLGDGLSTADVFRAWDGSPVFPPMDPTRATEALRSFDFDLLRLSARNALTDAAASLLPEIPEKIALLYDLGARYAQMSGSGSTVYGVFNRPEEARQAARMLGKNAIVAETLP